MQKNNIESIQKNCSGCGACYAVCPKNAIIYEINEEGFFEARVDKKKCINCGKCVKVCAKNPINNINILEKGKLYAARTRNDEILKKCTSGGIAYEIGKYGVENGYYLVGTIYNYEKNIAETIITDDLNGLNKLVGSKYLQSRSNDSFKELITLLKKDKNNKAIVFGTPCQIYGARNMIEIENLKNDVVFVDLFCHGVPSYLIWNKYLEELKEKEHITKINEVNFRDKKYGWHNYVLKIVGNKTEYKKAERNSFYKTFFDNALLNKSCMTCEVRKKVSCADIRLGDFWGKKFATDTIGVSAVVVLSDIGQKLLEKISSSINILETNINTSEVLRYQSTKDYNQLVNRKLFLEKLNQKESLYKIVKSYRKSFSTNQKIIFSLKSLISYLPSNIKIKLASKLKK